MQSIQIKTHIGEDGLLQVRLPAEIQNKDVEIMIIIQPLEPSETQSQHLCWQPGFFEEVIGGWEGEPLVREPQGELPEREPFL